jgi:hypothetical protein
VVSFTRLGVPIIASLIVGGIASFMIVFNSYPEKHENVQVNGKCFELKGAAHTEYNELLAHSKKNYLKILTSKITGPHTMIPITFTGQNTEVNQFVNEYEIDITSKQNVIFYPNVNGSVVVGNISGSMLSKIINNLSVNDLLASSKSIEGSISIIPNALISQQEFDKASVTQKQFVQNGLKEIITNSSGTSQAECRYQPDHPVSP